MDKYRSITDNYNPMATSNDSSCQYTCKNYQLNISTDCWGQEISWHLTKDDIIIEYVNENEYDDTTSYSHNFYLTITIVTLLQFMMVMVMV